MGTTAEARQAPPFETRVLPVYFPQPTFAPELDLTGRFAVITGASRGIGRATADGLVARGVTVIGTSRNVAGVPSPPSSYDLLDLDITSEASVGAFVSALLAHPAYPGHIDILISNAGRYVVGTIVPPPIGPDPAGYFMGPGGGWGGDPLQGTHARHEPAAATPGPERVLAPAVHRVVECLFRRRQLRRGGVRRRHPQLPERLHVGEASPAGVCQQPARFLGSALPPSFVADTYAQLLSMADPFPNVAVASPSDPATAAGVAFFNDVVAAENQEAALRLGCALPRLP